MIDYPIVIKKQKNTTFTNREKFLMEGSKQIKTRFITSLSTHKNNENNYSPFLNIIPSMYQEKSKPKFVQPSMASASPPTITAPVRWSSRVRLPLSRPLARNSRRLVPAALCPSRWVALSTRR